MSVQQTASGNGQKPLHKLVIITDLNKCFGCNACQLGCKSWHTSSIFGPMTDLNPWGEEPWSLYFMRVVRMEVGEYPNVRTTPVPISCFQCEDPPCVKVCPTGAIYKRVVDGVVVIDYTICQGFRYCINACPYGNITYDPVEGVSKKCVLCVDRLYDDSLPAYERVPACVAHCPSGVRIFGDLADPDSEVSRIVSQYGGFPLGAEYGTKPEELYLPVRGPTKGPFADEPRKIAEGDLAGAYAERTGAVDAAPEKVVQDAQKLGLTRQDLRTYKRNEKIVLKL